MTTHESRAAGKQEAAKTYVEQTKLLVTLASAFLLAPVGLVALLKDRAAIGLTSYQTTSFVIAEILFVLSVLSGYVVLGCVTGSQDDGSFDVFRRATRCSSLAQLAFYVLGLSVFVCLAIQLASLPITTLPTTLQVDY